ncbi:MAG: choice-of-anchor Q domain-containing protein [Pirellulales bacterium]
MTGTIDLSLGELLIDKDLTVAGPGAQALTIDASGSDVSRYGGDGSRIFNIDDGTTNQDSQITISGLTLTGGDPNGTELAIRSSESLLLADAIVRDNVTSSAKDGGGIWSNGTLVIRQSTISGNTTGLVNREYFVPFQDGNGGGIWSQGTLALYDSFVTDNSVGDSYGYSSLTRNGGGIWASGSIVISNSEITGTRAGSPQRFDDGGNGGGLWSSGSVLIRESLIAGNSAGGGGSHESAPGRGGEGGGVFFEAGDLRIVTTKISDNTAGTGGGAASFGADISTGGFGGSGGGLWADGAVEIRSSTISGNTAGNGGGGSAGGRGGWGGGMRLGGMISVTDSSIFNNQAGTGQRAYRFGGAGGSGGGIWAFGETTISGSTFSGNTAGQGGDVFVRYPFYSSHIGEGGNGGGILIEGTVTIRNSTISQNLAGQGGIASYLDDERGIAGIGGGAYIKDLGTTLSQSIVSGNHRADGTSDDLSGELRSESHYNLIGVGTGLSGITDGSNGNRIGTAAVPMDPLLGALQDNGGPIPTHALLAGSPAIDAGEAGFVGPPLADGRGFYRVVDGDGDMSARIAIGAYEYASVAVLAGDGNADGAVDEQDYDLWALRFAESPEPDPSGAPLAGDYNSDGVVNGLDYLVWAVSYEAALQAQKSISAAQYHAATEAVFAALDDDHVGVESAVVLKHSIDSNSHTPCTSDAFDVLAQRRSEKRHAR